MIEPLRENVMEPSSDTRVVVADDHAIVRDTIAEFLDHTPGVKVVARVGDAAELLVAVARELPHLVLTDVELGDTLAFGVAREIAQHFPSVRLVFVTAFPYDRYIEEALALGADGFVTKEEQLGVLETVVREVRAGRRFFSPQVVERITQGAASGAEPPLPKTRKSALTRRELGILRLVAQGLAAKQVALHLHLSVKTVETHCANLMRKLDIHDRVELTRYAIREGLVEV